MPQTKCTIHQALRTDHFARLMRQRPLCCGEMRWYMEWMVRAVQRLDVTGDVKKKRAVVVTQESKLRDDFRRVYARQRKKKDETMRRKGERDPGKDEGLLQEEGRTKAAVVSPRLVPNGPTNSLKPLSIIASHCLN
jgi:hypothetical protein